MTATSFFSRFIFLLAALPAFLFPTLAAAQFNTNGSASNIGNGCYHITPDQSGSAGSVFSSSTIDLTQPFSLECRMFFGNKDVNGADGIVFHFATTSTALGLGGGGLGYQGVSPLLSVEYDDYQNGGFVDPAADHVAITQNGDVNHATANNLAGPIALPNIEDNQEHCFSVNWDPGSNTLTATLDAVSISYTGNVVASIFGGNPNVYYGFSSGTGALSNLHRVCIGPPDITPMTDLSVCPGGSQVLQPDPDGLAYSWSPSPTLSATNIENPTATPIVTTTYNVTITFPCGASATDNVMVTVLPPPSASASNNGPLCTGETLQLTASGGTGYVWSSPNGFSSSQQTPSIPNVDFADNGIYTVTVTGANGCTATASTVVTVFPPPVTAIVPPGVFCINEPVQQLTGVPAGGVWSGAANAQGQVNPATLGAGSHTVIYTFTDGNGCAATDTETVVISALPNVVINPAGPFCAGDPVQTMSASPVNGIWGGVANPSGQINPSALGVGMHLVTYQYIDGNGCEDSEFIVVTILAASSPVIQPTGPFCVNSGLQTLSASPPGGTWGGAANAAGQVNPATLGAGTHTVTYLYSPPGSCPGATTATITINPLPTASISGGGIICSGSGQVATLNLNLTGAPPILVTLALGGVPQAPQILAPGSSSISATNPGTYTIFSVTDANGCINTGSGSAQVSVVTGPQVANLNLACNATNTAYTVTFQATGNVTSVSGSPGTLNTAVQPFGFTSDPIPAGQPYNFTVNDLNNCNPVTLSGAFVCGCTTSAGTMNTAPLTPCVNQNAIAPHNGNHVLDGNDLLIFILHDGNGNSLGNIFGQNTLPIFPFAPPMQTGVTYYISAVAGNANGSGGVVLSDPCLSVSFGTPVVFHGIPVATLLGGGSVCEGESATLSFQISGTPPFDVTYSANGINIDLENIFNGHTIVVTPTIPTTYTVEFVASDNPSTCFTIGGNSVTVEVNEPETSSQTISICQGESVFLGGASQSTPGTYTDSLTTFDGCDSILLTTLTVNALDTVFLSGTSCNPAATGTFFETVQGSNGCDSTIVTTINFSDTETVQVVSTTCDPASTGTFTNTFQSASGGCDSTVIETVLLLPSSDTTFIFDTSCNPGDLGVFPQNLSNGFGCDSVVVLTVTFSPTDTTLLSSTTCDPAAAGVFVQNLVTPQGCDSTVIETVSLLPSSPVTFLFDTSCDPASTGVFTQNLANQSGCDSTVVLTVTFSESDTTLLTGSNCDPTQTGVFVQNLITPQGCDSTVITTVTFIEPDTTLLTGSNCDPTQTGVFVQNLVTPQGCDSVVITTVSLLPSDAIALFSTTCDPGGVGVFTQDLENQFGCDSVVVTTVTLLPSDQIFLTAETCDPSEVGVFPQNLENQFGCDSTVVTTVSLLPPAACGVEASLIGSSIPCDATTGSLALIVSVGEPPFSYDWSGPTSGSGTIAALNQIEILTGLPAGNYTVTVTSAGGLTAVSQGEIVQLTPPSLALNVAYDYNGFGVSCIGGNDGSLSTVVSGGAPPLQFEWSNGASGSQLDDLGAGDYALTVTDFNGCTDSAEALLDEPDSLSILFTVNDLACFDETGGAIFSQASGGVQPYRFSLNGGDFQSGSQFSGLTAGAFEITVQDANGCRLTEALLINAPLSIEVELGDDRHIDLGDGTSLEALVNVPFSLLDSVFWSGLDSSECPTCLTQIVAPLITSTYSVSVTNAEGCLDDDALTVYVDRRKHVYVPNAFSPNGDGLNDELIMFAKERTVKKIRTFLVFSRWGETVFSYYNFQPNDPAFGWDGEHRGKPLNPAVFTWFAVVDFVDGETELFEGSVNLIR